MHQAISIVPEWNSDELFPVDEYDRPTLVNRRVCTTDSQAIERRLRSWSPYSSDLAGGGGGHLLPPVCVESMRIFAKKSYLRRYAFAISIWILAALFATFHARKTSETNIGWVALALAGYFAGDYFVLARRSGLEQRVRFIHWLKKDRKVRRVALYATLFAASVGALQLFLALVEGGTSNLIRSSGLVFDDVDRGQLWRLITGPYLHADIFHFLGNASLFVPALVFARLVAGKHALLTFAIGNILTATFAWWHASGAHDAFAGVSGGVMALLGLSTVMAFVMRVRLPDLLFINFGALSVLSLAVTCLLNSAALPSTHLAGFGFGVLYGVCLGWYSSKF